MASAVLPPRVSTAVPRNDSSAASGATAARRVWWLTLAGALVTYLVIVAGGIVRVTGSGLGCGDDWPTCNGHLVPLFTLETLIEFSHRFLAALDSAVILAVPAAAWLWRRDSRRVLVPATLIPFLLAVQIGLGALVVKLDLAPMAVLVHLGFAMLILGGMTWLAVHAAPVPYGRAHDQTLASVSQPPARHYRWLVAITAATTFGLILTGAYTRATGSGAACLGFPSCTAPAEVVQALEAAGVHNPAGIQLAHRFAAYVVTLLVVASVAETWRLYRRAAALRRVSVLLGLSLVAQATIGALTVSTGLPAALRGAHVAGAAATWAMAVLLASLAWRPRRVQPSPLAATVPVERSRPVGNGDVPAGAPAASASGLVLRTKLRAYFSLTKPKVILLLEVPTLAAMLVAAPQLPSLLLVVATLLGGAFAAGGAAAINAYLDRDIDPLMGDRTMKRAIPSGAVSAGEALAFGLGLALLSFVVLWGFANFLAAVLAQIALLVYVFVYTYWLKRSTPSNIVIGGAAGAIPPMVGWAAVTGSVGPVAWLLFAIIFFWTPPHFWALSLLIKQHYQRARVPMLPVVRGDAETRRQIVYYTVQMICVTLLLFAFQLSGLFYLASALVLGGIFLYLAARLWREATARAASRLFHYSMLYLWLLSAALVLDKRVFW